MYALNFRKPTTMQRHREALERPRARHVRDDLEMPLAIDPALDPVLDTVDQGAVLEEPTVQAVTPVDPQVKKYRATITRTVTQTAIVEYEALETQASYSVAEDLAAQVPAESWTTDPSNSWCYIDKLEDLGPAGAADPAIETADDDTLETDPQDPSADNPDDEAPLQAGRRRRRFRGQRAMPEDLISQAQDILDQASSAYATLGTEGTDPQTVVDSLQQSLDQLQALQMNAEGDTSGSEADLDAQVSAVQFINDAAQQIAQMLEEAQADVFAAESEPAAA